MDASDLPGRGDGPFGARGRALLFVVAALAGAGALLGPVSSSFGARAPEPAVDVDKGAGARAWLFGEKLDLNRASAADLSRVPGIGDRLARAIVDERQRRGGFRSLDEVDAVRGVGPAKLRLLSQYVEVRRSGRGAQRAATSDERPVTTVP